MASSDQTGMISGEAYQNAFKGRKFLYQYYLCCLVYNDLKELTEEACQTYVDYNLTDVCGLDHWSSLATNFLKINIYFEDLNYEIISEEPFYDATQLISDIGGSLGLCLGASLLCLFEVFEALAMVVVVLFRKLRGHTAVSEVSLNRTALHEFRSSKA